jgi:hypothetical protein
MIFTRFRLVPILLLMCVPASVPAQTPRIDPAGIDGALLLCGGFSETSAERFVELAGGEKAKLVFVVHDEESVDRPLRIWEEVKLIGAAARKKKAGPAAHVYLEDAKKALKGATGVCLLVVSPKTWNDVIKKHALADEFRAVLKRGGVIATSTMGVYVIASAEGIDLLPGGLVEGRFFEEKQFPKDRLKVPGRVGYTIDLGAAILVKGRTISAVGDHKTTIHVTGNPALREIVVAGNNGADLTALRRSAFDRGQGFPPTKVEPPVVEKGTLVLVGGGGSPDGL